MNIIQLGDKFLSEIKTQNEEISDIIDIIKLEYEIDEKDEMDMSKSFFVMIECSIDDGKIWRDVGGFGWSGGKKSVSRYGDPQFPFIQISNCKEIKNAKFRIKIHANKEILTTYKITVI